MNRKKEPCRNFQRGSCQYGERCKFLHVTQQQPKPNVSGFGAQTSSNFQHTNVQQQKSNPFGFGVQSNSLPTGATDFGSKQNHFKPFENKWTRFSPLTTGTSSSSRQSDNQAQPANHKCTDPESCKRQIVEDFEHERPIWKLTCYGHCKSAPCDIVGDISYEELRLAAYDDAGRGLNLQSIVERERSLLNSKLIEFDSLLRKPYAAPPNSTLAIQSPAPNPDASSLTAQNNTPPSASSFSQLSTSPNMGFGTRPSTPSNNAFGQSNSFQFSSQTSGAFGTNNLAFGNAGSFGSQLPVQMHGSPLPSNTAGFSHNNMSAGSKAFSPAAAPPQIISLANNQSPILSNGTNSMFGAESTMHAQLLVLVCLLHAAERKCREITFLGIRVFG
ncbi:zinc finger CCCH domain-containing protein 16 isoform X2 [Vitis riparia]|uniref:zinc finger CCCH domain-containing protein 16 isoform X2 n=1 Tax=Vitis riparia TaxID=96939 RepID=UPI00155AF065|nr:zinc finger CCCH domain-containing protein 16 isoform X2 [Vitis riparia]